MSDLLHPSVIAKEMLMVLENELVLANLVHRTFSSEYQKIGSTVTIRKPTTFTSASVDSTINLGTAVESSVNVVLNQHLDVTFEVETKELSLDIVDFSAQFIQPAMRAHAQKVDTLIAGLYLDVAAHYAVSATPSVADITNIRSVQNILKVPMSDRRLVFHPATEAKYLPLDAFLHAEKRGDTGAIKEASMGRVLGYDCYMDQNIPSHTTGPADMGGTVIQGTASTHLTVSSGTVYLGGLTDSQVLFVGDIFKFTDYDEWFTVTKLSTVGSGGAGGTADSAKVEFKPPVVTEVPTGTAVTFADDHRVNLAFHKNAFALVTAPLAPPIGGAKASVMNYNGLSCRVVYGYTMETKKNMISLDMLCGVKTLDLNLAARLTD